MKHDSETVQTYTKGAQAYAAARARRWFARGIFREEIGLLPSDGRILDYGCGPGQLVQELEAVDFSGEYIGYDPSEGMVQTAQSSHPSYTFLSEQDQIEGKFDMVFCLAVIHHTPPSQLRAFLEKLYEYEQESGLLMVSSWLVGNIVRNHKYFDKSKQVYQLPLRDGEGDAVGLRAYYHYTRADLEEVVRSLGYESTTFVIENNIVLRIKKGLPEAGL